MSPPRSEESTVPASGVKTSRPSLRTTITSSGVVGTDTATRSISLSPSTSAAARRAAMGGESNGRIRVAPELVEEDGRVQPALRRGGAGQGAKG
jgi:hypothetical protein